MNKRIIISLISLASALSVTAQPSPAVKIFYNGTIYTMDPKHSTPEAVAISNDKIIAVGSLASVKKSAGKKAEMIDLQGKFLLPGLIDSHNHAIKGGERLLTADMEDEFLSPQALAEFAQQSIQSGKGMREGVLFITGVHSSQWTRIGTLDSIFNEAPYHEMPVILFGTDGHTAWCNYFLLQRANISNESIQALSQEERTYYGRRADGQINGLISEEAIQKIKSILPKSSVTMIEGAVNGMKHLNSLGITAWLDPSAGHIGDSLNNPYLIAYKQIAQEHQLTAHVATTVISDLKKPIDYQIQTLKNIKNTFEGKDIHVLGFKIFADGVMEFPTQTAALSKAYINSGDNGALMVDPDRLKEFVTAADRNGFLIHIHAIGDRAVSVSLDAIAAARKTNKNTTIPHVITHLQVVVPSDYPRFKALNVFPSMQLLWATADHYTMELVKPYIDPGLFRHQYPAMSLVRAGATLCGASDWPVSSANPFVAIAMAETRRGKMGILNSNEVVPRIDMIKAYTINAARSLLLESHIGSIEKGKQADFILVDRDVFAVDSDAVGSTQIIWTLFDGRFVFKTGGQE